MATKTDWIQVSRDLPLEPNADNTGEFGTTAKRWQKIKAIEAILSQLAVGTTGFLATEKLRVSGQLLVDAGFLQLQEVTAPTTPPASFGRVYSKADGRIYYKNAAGTEYDLTAAAAAGGWTDSGTTLELTTPTDTVVIGASVPVGTEKVRIVGDQRLEGFLEISEIPAPALPPAGVGRLYEKIDGKIYFKNAAGTEYDLTATGAVSGSLVYSAVNKELVTLKAGQPVAVHASGSGIIRADATDDTKNVVGFVVTDIPSLASGTVQVGGVLSLADWTDGFGAVSLTSPARYYLDTSPGLMSIIPPGGSGQVVQFLGRALSATEFLINIADVVQLA